MTSPATEPDFDLTWARWFTSIPRQELLALAAHDPDVALDDTTIAQVYDLLATKAMDVLTDHHRQENLARARHTWAY
jgi:hypothetical protein